MRLNPADLLRRSEPNQTVARAPLSGSRSQTIQRLQVGGLGLAVMLLLVGLASIVISRARDNQALDRPAAVASAAAETGANTTGDPLADAGVVPDMPSSQETGSPDGQSPQGN